MTDCDVTFGAEVRSSKRNGLAVITSPRPTSVLFTYVNKFSWRARAKQHRTREPQETRRIQLLWNPGLDPLWEWASFYATHPHFLKGLISTENLLSMCNKCLPNWKYIYVVVIGTVLGDDSNTQSLRPRDTEIS